MKAFTVKCALLSTFALFNIPRSLCANSKHVQISQPGAQFSNAAFNTDVLDDALSLRSGESTHLKKHSTFSPAADWLHRRVQTHIQKRDADANMPGLRGSEQSRTNAHIAHGTVMGVAIVLFFPLGAMMMKLFRFPGLVWIHAAVQMVGMLVLITGFALGIWLSILHNEIWNKQHEVFGTVIFCLFLAQPLLGLLNHHIYRISRDTALQKVPNRWLCRVHVWHGRILIILGIVNGGLGLQLADNTTSGEIAYGVVTGVVFVVYIFVLGLWYLNKYRGAKDGQKLEQNSTSETELEVRQQDMEGR